MSESFSFDVFLSHSSQDKAVVRGIAERLRGDGVRVWFDEWELRPGDHIQAKIEDGLERSRVLVLCMSASAFGSKWAQLEAGTFRFRDPLNTERRFIPVRLDDAPVKGSLAPFLYIDWRDSEYTKLLEACRRPSSEVTPERQADREQSVERVLSLGHTSAIRSVAWSPVGGRALSGSEDNTIRLWETDTGHCLRVLEGHSASVVSVAFSPDGGHALSGAADKTVRLWETETGHCLRVLKGHSASVTSVAFSPDGGHALSGAADKTVRLWEIDTGRCLQVLEGHSDSVWSVAFSPNRGHVLSGADDKTVRLWETDTGRCLRVLEGHSGSVFSVAFSPDGGHALSGAADKTVRLWERDTGRCQRVLEGHSASVWSVAFSPDGRHALSGAADNTMRLWETATGHCLRVLEGHSATVLSVAFSPDGRHALSGAEDNTVRLWETGTGRGVRVLEGHSDGIWSVAWSSNRRLVLSGANDRRVRLWETDTGRCLRAFEGHSDRVMSVAFSPDGRQSLSGSGDDDARIWEIDTGRCLRVLSGHSRGVDSVVWSSDGRHALSGSADNTVRLWETATGRCLCVLKGHSASVRSVAFSPDGRQALSGAADNTVRLWETGSGQCLRLLEGHSDSIWSVVWSPEGRRALSGGHDKTVRLWETATGRCLRVLEGHSASVLSLAWSPDGRRALSGSHDKTVRLWETETGRCLRVLEGHSASVLNVAWSPDGQYALSAAVNGVMRVWSLPSLTPIESHKEAQVQYTNAKVLLVGDSGAGKTGLSMRLALNDWKPSDSTVGAWATHWKLPVSSADGVEREIWLWDFGGQADQRLIHQLYMDDTALAVLVFDGQKEDVFETLEQWDRDLTRASRRVFAKLLAAGRTDAGGLRVSRSEVEKFAKERGFKGQFLETSAKAGSGCEELKQAILAGIDWAQIPWRSSPLVFKRLKEEIIRLKDEGRVLMRFNELRDALRLRLAGKNVEFTDEELRAVVGLLAGPGVVWELKFGNWVLLQPERINAYAQAVIQTLRADEHERGCLPEERVLAGDLTYQSSLQRLDQGDERFVLLAMHQTLVERGLCLREHTDKGTLLIFPSYYRRERPELVGHPAVLVSYRFAGFIDDIYATLVVRLHHTNPFQQDQLWRYAADFKTLTGKQLGVKVTRRAEGAGELEVYFDPAIPVQEKIIFSRYVHEHLLQKGQDVIRLRHYVCPHCGTPVGNREVAMRKLAEGKRDVLCMDCEKRIPLWDEMEELFASAEMKQQVRELQEQSDVVLDNESKERALVGEVISTVALAGQICREFNVSDHGIDMEIEFKNDEGEASGRKLYLQLKSGESYTRERKRDGAEIFKIKKVRHARYWMDQAFPVLLVIRNSEGQVRWMEVRDWLKRATEDGKRAVRQIVFEGERFDVMSVRRWREKMLGAGGRG